MTLNSNNTKAFTLKSILGGLLGVLLISGFSGFNDNVLNHTFFVGNHFPVGGYFYFFCLAFLWNCVIGGMLPKLRFTAKELVVVLGMTLVACWVPTSGLFRYFHRQIILPWYYNNNMPLWQKTDVLSYLPKKIFPNEGVVDDTVYMGFVQGMAKGNQTLGLSELPLAEWMSSLSYWGPLFVLFAVTTIALSLLVHKQWAHHEQLSYPLASVANSLIKRTTDKTFPDIYANRVFWMGLIPVLSLYMINYLAAWFPEYVPWIPLNWNASGFNELFPAYRQSGAGVAVIERSQFLFTIIGVSYFISSSIGFSMGISQILLAILFVQYYLITGDRVSAENLEVARSGAYIAYACILVYTGWSYYKRIFTAAFLFREEKDKDAIFAARLLLVSFVGMVAMLTIMGLDWFIALLFCTTMMILFIVFSRIICESGIPFLQANWHPGAFLIQFFGSTAIGAGPLVFISYLNALFTQDPRESLAPYVATSLKVADDNKVSLISYSKILIISVILALVVGFSVTFFNLYNFGAFQSDGWASVSVPKTVFSKAANELNFLSESGTLQQSIEATGLAKLAQIQFDSEVIGWFSTLFVLVIGLSLFRFRFAKFPIHPILFLVWGTYPTAATWFCFLVGWIIKELIVKFGGGKSYQELKPLFVGLIIGELLAAGISIVVGTIYYSITGVTSVWFRILPG